MATPGPRRRGSGAIEPGARDDRTTTSCSPSPARPTRCAAATSRTSRWSSRSPACRTPPLRRRRGVLARPGRAGGQPARPVRLRARAATTCAPGCSSSRATAAGRPGRRRRARVRRDSDRRDPAARRGARRAERPVPRGRSSIIGDRLILVLNLERGTRPSAESVARRDSAAVKEQPWPAADENERPPERQTRRASTRDWCRAAEQVATAANAIARMTDEVSDGAEAQIRSLDGALSGLNEMAASLTETAGQAESVSALRRGAGVVGQRDGGVDRAGDRATRPAWPRRSPRPARRSRRRARRSRSVAGTTQEMATAAQQVDGVDHRDGRARSRRSAATPSRCTASVNETAAAIEEMSRSIRRSSANADDLAAAAEETSSSINEMAASIEEVGAMTESLGDGGRAERDVDRADGALGAGVAQNGRRITEAATRRRDQRDRRWSGRSSRSRRWPGRPTR